MDRIGALRQLLEVQPSNVFARYGLAQEYAKRSDFGRALDEYARVLEQDPDYQAAYFHAGKALERLRRPGLARKMYQDGIKASFRTGDVHARAELEEALAEIAV